MPNTIQKKNEYIDSIERSRQSDVLVAQCIQFTDQHGIQQLQCILEGGSSFKISRVQQADCLEVTRKIRFIGEPFFYALHSIRTMASREDQLRQLHQVLGREIREGRVIVEVKTRNSRTEESGTVAIMSKALAALGPVQIHKKNGQQKTYSRTEEQNDDYFIQLAEAFSKALLPSLSMQTSGADANRAIDKSSMKEIEKAVERNFFVNTMAKLADTSRWLIASIQDICSIFDSKQELKRGVETSFERQRESETHEAKIEMQERSREERRADIARKGRLDEAISQDNKRFGRRQEERIHTANIAR
jgi:hypothetical protein